MGDNKLLIVEDQESISNAIMEMLTLHGIDVVAISDSGEDAMVKFNQHHPQMVLMDILLPDVNGLEIAREMLAIDPELKIIAISALADEDLRERSLAAGCLELLVKPFRMKELVDTVKRVGGAPPSI